MASHLAPGCRRVPRVSGLDADFLRLLDELRHPHLALLQGSEADGFEPDKRSACFLSELLQKGPIPLRLRLRILLDVLSGVAAIHGAKLDGEKIVWVHGEVAPGNVLVGRDGSARLVPVLTGAAPGVAWDGADVTGYQAPELLLGDSIDQRIDIFSAGVLLWEALANARLFDGVTPEVMITRLVGNKILAPVLSGEDAFTSDLAEIAMRAIEVDPDARFSYVGTLGADVETVAEGHLATANELAAFMETVLGRESRSSFSTEAPVPRPFPDGMGSVESVPAVSSSVLGYDTPSFGVPHSDSRVSVPHILDTQEAPPSRPAGGDESPGQGAASRARAARIRWSLVAASVGLSGVLLLFAAAKAHHKDEPVTASVTILTGSAVTATPRSDEKPEPPATAELTLASSSQPVPSASPPNLDAKAPLKPVRAASSAAIPGSPAPAGSAPRAPARKWVAADRFGI